MPTAKPTIQANRATNDVVTAADWNTNCLQQGNWTQEVISGVSADKVVRAALAPAAIQVGHVLAGAASNPTTTSGSFVQIPDLALLSFTAIGGDIWVWMFLTVSNSVAGNGTFVQLNLDSGAQVSPIAIVSSPVAGYNTPITIFHRFTAVSAGVHSIAANWHVDSGTSTATLQGRQIGILELQT
jgi:hypothetical protein